MANPALGYGMALVSCLFFGSNFVVTKRFPTGDGFFFNWAMTSAIFVCGLLFHVGLCGIQGQCPRFEPFAMLGGAIWCIGNLWVVPIVQCIGLGLGLCVWGSSNMLTGWASAHFGILGLKADPAPASPVLHYIGVALAVCSMATFLLIKSSVGDEGGKMAPEHAQALLAGREAGADRHSGHAVEAGSLQVDFIEQPPSRSWVDRLSPAQRKAFGLTFSLISGVCYGGSWWHVCIVCAIHGNCAEHTRPAALSAWRNRAGANFNPPQAVIAHPEAFPGAPQQLIDYVFPHFCGIFLTATVFMFVNGLVTRNSPQVFSQTTVPAMASGVVWAIAQVGFFFASQNLGQSISFPIISTGPSLVGALWGVFAFGEIKGRRNLVLLGIAFAFVISASTCISLSKGSS
jgi:glucose uptake protein GlcU